MTTINNHIGVPHFWFEKSGPEGEAPYKSRKNGDYYPEIAQLIADLLPYNFQEAYFSIEMIDDV